MAECVGTKTVSVRKFNFVCIPLKKLHSISGPDYFGGNHSVFKVKFKNNFGVLFFWSPGLEPRKHLVISCSFDFLVEWM